MALYTFEKLDEVRQRAKLLNLFRTESGGFHKTAREGLLAEMKRYSGEKSYDIFMSHATVDANAIFALRHDIVNMGFSVYVDWVDDPQLDRARVSIETALILKQRMSSCRSLIYVVSYNSVDSKWMPWELGYFDGNKGKVGILPIVEPHDSTSRYHGQEYLGLYPYVEREPVGHGSRNSLIVNLADKTPISYGDWLGNRSMDGIF